MQNGGFFGVLKSLLARAKNCEKLMGASATLDRGHRILGSLQEQVKQNAYGK